MLWLSHLCFARVRLLGRAEALAVSPLDELPGGVDDQLASSGEQYASEGDRPGNVDPQTLL